MKIVINGVELDVPPDAALEIGRDDEGQLMVYVDEAGNPLGFGNTPEPALAQFLSNSAACDCPTCRQDRARARGDSVAEHPAADIDGELVAAPWHMTFRTNLIDAVVRHMERDIGEDYATVLRDYLNAGENALIAVVVSPQDMGLGPAEAKEEF